MEGSGGEGGQETQVVMLGGTLGFTWRAAVPPHCAGSSSAAPPRCHVVAPERKRNETEKWSGMKAGRDGSGYQMDRRRVLHLKRQREDPDMNSFCGDRNVCDFHKALLYVFVL